MKGPIRGTLFDKEVLVYDVELAPNSFSSLTVEGEMMIKVVEKVANFIVSNYYKSIYN